MKTAFWKGAAFALACIASLFEPLYRYAVGYAQEQGFILAANDFSKEERVAFEELLAGFQDALVLSRACNVFRTNQTEMERSVDIIWRPQPYVSQSFTGMDQTANFKDYVQLSVPAAINIQKSVPWKLSGTELRDALQEGRLFSSAKQKLASDINVSLNTIAAQQGSLVVKRTAAATGFDDVAQAEAIMNEQGVQYGDRFMGLSTRDYNGMASNLAGRGTMQGRPDTAYGRALVGNGIANFDILKMDYTPRYAVAAGVTVTMNGANQYYTPSAGTADVNGGLVNTDNRFQTITIGVVSGLVKVGDAFTIAGVNAVHHITKQDTGQLKTFRINAIVTGGGGAGTVQITPPIISAQGATDAEKEYRNVTATPANGAAITFLNTAAGYFNPFWHKEALEILPSTIAFPPDAGAQIMRGSTDQGFELVMAKQFDIKTGQTFYRVDTRYGVVNKQPEMSGVILFSMP